MESLIKPYLLVSVVVLAHVTTVSTKNIRENSYSPMIYLLDIAVSGATAQDIYKSVDDEGNVTYSEEPPTEIGNVDVLENVPAPSTEETKAAQKRIQELETSSIELEQEVKSLNSEQEDTDNNKVAPPVGRTYVPVGAPVVHHRRNDLQIMPHRRRR